MSQVHLAACSCTAETHSASMLLEPAACQILSAARVSIQIPCFGLSLAAVLCLPEAALADFGLKSTKMIADEEFTDSRHRHSGFLVHRKVSAY